MSDLNEQFTNNLRESLNQDTESIDSETRRKLQAARHDALAKRRNPNVTGNGRPTWAPRLVPMAMLSVALLVVVGLWEFSSPETGRNSPPQAISKFEISADLTGSELELVEELEFYEWLDLYGYAG